MRATKREEALSVFQSLHRAHGVLRRMSGTNTPDGQDILALCQNGAIQIGNEVERWHGAGTRTVGKLEDYCEAVYQYAESKSPQKDAAYQKMEDALAQAQGSFCEEITADKLEVVFFPYNASMWASMASVWKAAKEDESCNAYVVPIPYYEKKPDGSFGEMHYEGNLLPADVPITPWEDYPVAQRCPDFIFIHNPYDQNNYVTSVHPDYYSSALRDYTANLIFLPYYLFVNDNVSEVLLMTSAVLYADFVIEQSEESCRKCIQIYDEYLKRNGFAGKLKPGKDKFLPFGSPIADSVRRRMSVGDLPKVWQDTIRRKGEQAKIVLYNTSLGNLTVPNAGKFLKKLESVLQTFKRQEDTVLLWRPHPLSWQTIRSMNPDIAGRYRRIVDTYREEGWGIYDDTPDVHRAVAVSDAFYGDWSSLITMCYLAGKPAMRQDAGTDTAYEVPGNSSYQAFLEENEVEGGLQGYLDSLEKHTRGSIEGASIGKTIWEFLSTRKKESDDCEV